MAVHALSLNGTSRPGLLATGRAWGFRVEGLRGLGFAGSVGPTLCSNTELLCGSERFKRSWRPIRMNEHVRIRGLWSEAGEKQDAD